MSQTRRVPIFPPDRIRRRTRAVAFLQALRFVLAGAVQIDPAHRNELAPEQPANELRYIEARWLLLQS